MMMMNENENYALVLRLQSELVICMLEIERILDLPNPVQDHLML